MKHKMESQKEEGFFLPPVGKNSPISGTKTIDNGEKMLRNFGYIEFLLKEAETDETLRKMLSGEELE